MNPVKFEEANVCLKANPKQTHYKGVAIEDLYIFHDGDKTISCWELSDEDIEYFKQHRKVWLGVLTNGTPSAPPIFAMAYNPFTPKE